MCWLAPVGGPDGLGSVIGIFPRLCEAGFDFETGSLEVSVALADG